MTDLTKVWIADTLKKVLAKKPLEKIRVSEICREAEIVYSIRLYCHGTLGMTR